MPEQSHVAVIGGGIMGGDIAVIFAAGGWNVHVMSPSQKTRDALPARLAAGLKKLGAPAPDAARMKAYGALEALPWQDISLVVEAATEDLALKQKLFARFEALARPDIPLVSNTSNFLIGEIGQSLKTRARVAGLHFFMPAHLVPLVEIVSAESTDPGIAERLVRLMKDLGKAPIWVKKDIPGFVGNRLQHALWREAVSLVEHGVCSAEAVDTVIKASFGRRLAVLGPLENADLVGTDLTLDIHENVLFDLERAPAPSSYLKDLVASGRLGVKTGEGFRKWTVEEADATRARVVRYLLEIEDLLDRPGEGAPGPSS